MVKMAPKFLFFYFNFLVINKYKVLKNEFRIKFSKLIQTAIYFS